MWSTGKYGEILVERLDIQVAALGNFSNRHLEEMQRQAGGSNGSNIETCTEKHRQNCIYM
jgi:hypothetical protein